MGEGEGMRLGGIGSEGMGEYTWPIWRYEARCVDCGAVLFLPDGESCICCGGNELHEVEREIFHMHLNAGTGYMEILPEGRSHE